ncbi:DivIVA domain-containing protein [Streptomyces sp. NBC_00239]|uniref:DivIVA domain-containing protein n=1 Tax=Streptomyces sp. NBC_00239 TaxID=2903640 RepID=UPI002E2DD09F|nr:DivIVA domain-containing protein [Streptomyces sp. NBC_00239]
MSEECCDSDSADGVPRIFRPDLRVADDPLLTPDDVHHQRFSTVRLREGYALGEVDEFLHAVESSLARLFRENEALRQQVAVVGALAAHHPTSSGDQAQRVLTLADRTAGDVITQAGAEATRIVLQAQTQAQEVEGEARARATQIEQEAHNQAAAVENGLHSKRSELQSLQQACRELERKVASLRSLTAEYRERLRANLDGQLDAIEQSATEVLEAVPPQGRQPWQAPDAETYRPEITSYSVERKTG